MFDFVQISDFNFIKNRNLKKFFISPIILKAQKGRSDLGNAKSGSIFKKLTLEYHF